EVQAQIPDSDKKTSIGHSVVDGDYFATFGIRILAGRVFSSSDRENDPEVVVINQKLAETFWPAQNAVGKSLIAGDPAKKAIVIGVAADGKYEDLDEPARPVMYYALSQHYQPAITVIARTNGNPRLWVEPINEIIRSVGVIVPFRPITFNDLINFN